MILMKKKRLLFIPKTSDVLSKILLFMLWGLSPTIMAQQANTTPSPHPYLSEHTLYMTLSDTYTKCVYNVSEGMFCVKDNGKIGTWSVDGDLKHSPKWKEFSYSSNNPMLFDHGALLVQSSERNEQGKEYYAILYKDCRVKKLNPLWEPVTPFVDGLAIVQKKEGYRLVETFFMNVNGEKLPSPENLSANYSDDIRPLKCGLRAFQSNRKWGFVDENLKVVLPPKWDAVRNFSEGYAWVFEKDKDSFFDQYKASLIDTKGNVICEIPSIESGGNILKSNTLGDVHDGRYFVSTKDDEVAYYKLPKTQIGSAERASSFHKGVALVGVQKDTHGYVLAVDKDFKQLAAYPTYSSDKEHYISHSDLNVSDLFESSDFASIETGSKVIDYQGRLVLKAYDEEFGDNYVSGFGQFGKDGYAVMNNITINSKHCLALVKANGEIAWLFSKEQLTKEELLKIPHNPNWEKSQIRYTNCQVQPCIKKGSIGNGAGKVTPRPNIEEEDLYNIKVVCHPEEGGKAQVPGSNRVKFGTKKEVVVTPNEGWYNTKVEVNGKVIKNRTFEVTDNVIVDVHFKEKDIIDTKTVLPPTTQDMDVRHYQGTASIDLFLTKEFTDIDMYAEISNKPIISSPFGDKTYGYISLMIDPKTYYTSKELSAYYFVTPFKIVGFLRDSLNKTYLILDGGSLVYKDLKVVGGGLLSLWLNTVITTNDWASQVAEARRYRLEIKDINPSTGEFTMGGLETFTTEYGWVPGRDCRAAKIKDTKTDHYHDMGFAKDDFKNCKMKLAPKRNDITWYPPMEWYGNDKVKYNELMEKMKVSYKDYGSDYNTYFIWK